MAKNTRDALVVKLRKFSQKVQLIRLGFSFLLLIHLNTMDSPTTNDVFIRIAKPTILLTEYFDQQLDNQITNFLNLCLYTAEKSSMFPPSGTITFFNADLSEAIERTEPILDTLQPKTRVYGGLKTSGTLLLIGAHPDDITLTMSSLVFAGFQRVVVVMCSYGTSINLRAVPAIAEAIAIRAHKVFLGNYTDETGPNLSQTELVNLWHIIREVKPTVVVTHLPLGDPHPCHTSISDLVTRAIWRFPPRKRPILLYARPPADFNESSFRADFHVAIDDRAAYLLARAIELHPSESKKPYYRVDHKLNLLAAQAAVFNRQGFKSRISWIESFMMAR